MVFEPRLYCTTQNYLSPYYALALPDADADDPTPTLDAFGKIFNMPADLASVTTQFHTDAGAANGTDRAFASLWTIDSNDQLVDYLGGWEIPDSPEAWQQQSMLVQNSADLAPMAGQHMAIVFLTDTDSRSPGEAVYCDDITLTACAEATDPPTATPTSTPTPRCLLVRRHHRTPPHQPAQPRQRACPPDGYCPLDIDGQHSLPAARAAQLPLDLGRAGAEHDQQR